MLDVIGGIFFKMTLEGKHDGMCDINLGYSPWTCLWSHP